MLYANCFPLSQPSLFFILQWFYAQNMWNALHLLKGSRGPTPSHPNRWSIPRGVKWCLHSSQSHRTNKTPEIEARCMRKLFKPEFLPSLWIWFSMKSSMHPLRFTIRFKECAFKETQLPTFIFKTIKISNVR